MNPATIHPPHALLAAYNDRDWERFGDRLAVDAIYEEIARPARVVEGREQIVAVFRAWAEAVPEARARIRREVIGTDSIAFEIEWLGGEAEQFGDFRPTGRRPLARAAAYFLVDGLEVREFRHFYDSLVLYQVLGIGG